MSTRSTPCEYSQYPFEFSQYPCLLAASAGRAVRRSSASCASCGLHGGWYYEYSHASAGWLWQAARRQQATDAHGTLMQRERELQVGAAALCAIIDYVHKYTRNR